MSQRIESAGLAPTTDSVEQPGTQPLPIKHRKGPSSIPAAGEPSTADALHSAKSALHDCDAMVQDTTGMIEVMCRSARQFLRPDSDALITLASLLDQIERLSDGLSNDVNYTAEKEGCHYRDVDKWALRDKINAACKAAQGGAANAAEVRHA